MQRAVPYSHESEGSLSFPVYISRHVDKPGQHCLCLASSSGIEQRMGICMIEDRALSSWWRWDLHSLCKYHLSRNQPQRCMVAVPPAGCACGIQGLVLGC